MGWTAPAAVILLVTFFFMLPAFRHSVRTACEQLLGFIDGYYFSRHRSVKAASALVEARMVALAHRTEVRFQLAISDYQRRSATRLVRLRDATRKAHAAVDEYQHELARRSSNAIPERAFGQFMSATAYYAAQSFIGAFYVGFSYFTLEFWRLPTLVLAPLAMVLGSFGVIIGHFLGQALLLRQREITVATMVAAIVYCVVIGGARFEYLVSLRSFDASKGMSVIAAFGVPFLVIFVSALLATQLRARTPLELARNTEIVAQRRADEAFQAELLASNGLSAMMHAQKARALELIGAYCMGFRLGWRHEAFEFPPEPLIEVPPLRSPPPDVPLTATVTEAEST